MSTHAPVREEQRPAIRTGIVEGPAERGSPFADVSLEEDEGYPIRRTAVFAAMGATTLVSAGALLGARFIGRRVTHGRRSIRVKGGSPRLVIMLPFTAINLYGRRSRHFGRFDRFGLRGLHVRTLHRAKTARRHMIMQLRARLRRRIAAGRPLDLRVAHLARMRNASVHL